MILVTLLLVAASIASPTPQPAPASPAPASAAPATTAVPSPAATPQAPPATGSAVTPAAATSPAPPGSPLPAPTSTATPIPFLYRFVPRQPDQVPVGTPQIFAVYLNDKKLHSQGPIDIKVTTSPDVVKVVSGSGDHQGIVPKIAPGDFEAYSKLPKVPFIAKGMTLYLQFTATGPSGATTTVRVPVQLF